MPQYVMRVEGVNFATTVLDTQDLSCIRGAGLALLYGMKRVEYLLSVEDGLTGCTTIHDGASQAAFTFQADSAAADRAADRIRQALATEGSDPKILEKVLDLANRAPDWKEWEGVIPLAHLTFVVDLAEVRGRDVDAALKLAEARNRARQYRQLSVCLPRMDPAAHWPDEVNRVLPATHPIHMPPDSVTPLPGEPEPEPHDKKQTTKVSPSVGARRHFGRRMRQMFYRNEIPDDWRTIRFTDSILSICDDAPKDAPETIRNKMAVIYMDGNKFSKIRGHIIAKHGYTEGLRIFSEKIKSCRKELLSHVMKTLVGLRSDPDTETRKRGWAYVDKGDGKALRFETLLWGGDDIVWVAPSWLAFWLVETVFSLSRSWTIGGFPLTHAAGVVLCDRKTPIRQATAMAEDLARGAKRVLEWPRLANVAQFEVFESADLPDAGADAHRLALYPGLAGSMEHIKDEQQKQRIMAALFTLPAAGITRLIDQFQPDGGALRTLPRSQIHRLLDRAVEGKAFGGGSPDVVVGTELETYLAGAGSDVAFSTDCFDRWREDAGVWGVQAARPLSLNLALAAQYWDYAAPFDGKPRPPHRPRREDAP